MTDKRLIDLSAGLGGDKLVEAYTHIVDYLKCNAVRTEEVANFLDTPERAARALREICRTDAYINAEVAKHLRVSFPVNTDAETEEGILPGFVAMGPITVTSICPHHLFPLKATVYLAYAPKDRKPLGLSKLARISKVLGMRPVLQEQLACDIADALYKFEYEGKVVFESLGSIVQVVGSHGCMSHRGVREDALTSTTEMRGCFWETGMESKFMMSVEAIARRHHNQG